MVNTYIDCITYKNAATGVYLTNLVGNIGRIGACGVSAASLAVTPATTATLSSYDSVYIFDGPNSEVVQVGASVAIGATIIPLRGNGTAYAHAGGTAYCTDGVQGSVGQAIFQASRWLEDICYQPLYSTAYTGEILTMPTMRAALDNQWNLHFRPRHFPITAFTSITLQQNQQFVLTLDPTQAIIDADQQTVDIPQINTIASNQQQQGNSQVYFWYPQWNRGANAWLTIGYTAGYAQGSIPWAITRAATLLTSNMFVQLENPVGADSINQGKRSVTFMIRGDTSGESLLYKEALKLLSPYVMQQF